MQDRPEIRQAIAALQRLCELFALRRQQLAAGAGLDESFMPSMFARRRDCTPAAISRGLRSLQGRGWVTAEIAAGDARQRRYRLTAEGRRLLERLRRGRERAIAAVWDGFDAAALRGFVAFAGELADHLEAYAKQRKSG
ncbi:MAG: winged helix-turn-helix transcriptional regulator [Deltaproteobacteria bacterium]|nr:MAG: winged helix-turn-helix transcriptional regulator [Deltaproteobacteria bacterium]